MKSEGGIHTHFRLYYFVLLHVVFSKKDRFPVQVTDGHDFYPRTTQEKKENKYGSAPAVARAAP